MGQRKSMTPPLVKFVYLALVHHEFVNLSFKEEHNGIFVLNCMSTRNKNHTKEHEKIFLAWQKYKPEKKRRKKNVMMKEQKECFKKALTETGFFVPVKKTGQLRTYKFVEEYFSAAKAWYEHSSDPVYAERWDNTVAFVNSCSDLPSSGSPCSSIAVEHDYFLPINETLRHAADVSEDDSNTTVDTGAENNGNSDLPMQEDVLHKRKSTQGDLDMFSPDEMAALEEVLQGKVRIFSDELRNEVLYSAELSPFNEDDFQQEKGTEEDLCIMSHDEMAYLQEKLARHNIDDSFQNEVFNSAKLLPFDANCESSVDCSDETESLAIYSSRDSLRSNSQSALLDHAYSMEEDMLEMMS